MDPTPQESGHQRLARLAYDRRDRYGWTQEEVATRGGISIDRVQAIEAGEDTKYRGKTLAGLDKGLYWEVGSARRVQRGGDPIELDVEPAAGEPPPFPLRDVVERKLWNLTELSRADRVEYIQLHRTKQAIREEETRRRAL